MRIGRTNVPLLFCCALMLVPDVASNAAVPIGLPRALPPPSSRVHVPISESEVRKPEPRPDTQHNFRGRIYAQLTTDEQGFWQTGTWRHESHNGHLGWWWVVGGYWYFYPEAAYPYPTTISDYTYPMPMISSQYLYYCGDPPGYYPEVKSCYDPWQLIPAAPPPPIPNAVSASTPEVRAGYRIARDICSACHVIHPSETRQPVLPQPGPRFAEIANRPGMTRESLERFITTTGLDVEARPVTMPNQGLSSDTTKEVASYIMSLRTQK